MTSWMEYSMFTARTLIVGALIALPCATHLIADSPLTDAKNLYAAASYEAALQALDRAEGPPTAEVLEYRALCLLALGRTDDAERVTEVLVTQSPMLVPSFEEFPPRFVSLVTDTRRTLLPQLARQLFAKGRDQFHADQKADATRQFEQVLVLANDPVLRADSEGADLRTLAMGYLDLLHAQPRTTAADLPRVQPRTTAAEQQTAAAPPAVTAPRPRIQKGPVVQAVPVRQTLPPWNVRTGAPGGELKGAVRVLIGIDGKVKSATIVTPIHPAYDAQVLAATRGWLYQPATLDGQAVESERVIDVRVAR